MPTGLDYAYRCTSLEPLRTLSTPVHSHSSRRYRIHDAWETESEGQAALIALARARAVLKPSNGKNQLMRDIFHASIGLTAWTDDQVTRAFEGVEMIGQTTRRVGRLSHLNLLYIRSSAGAALSCQVLCGDNRGWAQIQSCHR